MSHSLVSHRWMDGEVGGRARQSRSTGGQGLLLVLLPNQLGRMVPRVHPLLGSHVKVC